MGNIKKIKVMAIIAGIISIFTSLYFFYKSYLEIVFVFDIKNGNMQTPLFYQPYNMAENICSVVQFFVWLLYFCFILLFLCGCFFQKPFLGIQGI
ncbi:MAG: hypothetical protein ACK5L3_13465 [Oscillospiraceae bacterium]